MAAPFRFFYTYTCIIVHPTENSILLLPTDQGWSLPQHVSKTSQWPHWAEVASFNQDMQQQLNMQLTTIRCLCDQYRPENNSSYRIYVMEFHSPPSLLPPHARWVSYEEFINLTLVIPEYRLWCEKWLADRKDISRQAGHVPWYTPGWFARAASWIEKQLAHRGTPVVAPLEQLRVGERGCVFRVTTAHEICYFKALPPFFAHELSLLQYLAEQSPGLVPTLIATEDEQKWMLTQDFGNRLLSQSDVIEHWEQALHRYASLQVAQVGQTEHLLALKCPEISLASLAEGINLLLADTAELNAGLSEQEIARLRENVPQLRAMCHALSHYNIPQTLEHGDLWGGNIALINTDFVYFDWTDSCITHPFFSLYPFLLGIEARWSDIPDARTRLRTAYLQAWSPYASMDQLIAAFELAQKLAPLYLASLYALLIIPNMDAKWEMRYAVPHNLKILLERIDIAPDH